MTEKQLKDKINNKNNYEYYKKIGVCVRCKKNKAEEGKAQCRECLDARAEYALKRHYDGKAKYDKKKHSDYIKRKKQICDAFGICPYCMNREKYKGKECIECYTKRNRKYKEKSALKEKLPKNLWGEFERCMMCGGEREDGHKLCAEHLEMARANAKKARSSINRDEHIWRKEINKSVIQTQMYKSKNA